MAKLKHKIRLCINSISDRSISNDAKSVHKEVLAHILRKRKFSGKLLNI